MIPSSSEVRIEVSTKCNYNCVICARDTLTRAKEIMPTERFKYYVNKIIKETDQYDTLTFSGFGEPLMDNGKKITDILKLCTKDNEKIFEVRDKDLVRHRVWRVRDKDFIKKAEIAKRFGFDVLLLTNASLLSTKLFKQINEVGLESIRISFYGMNADSYKTVHNVNGDVFFERVRDTLTEICSMKRTTKIIFTYNVVPGANDRDVHDWIRYWEPIADLLEVWRPHNWVDGRDYRRVKPKKLDTCGRPFNGPLQVQVDGTVNICCFDYNGKLFLGDLKSQSLSEIFSSEAYRKIKKCHLTGNFEGSGLICEKCDQRNHDKSDIMVYNSKFDINERVRMVSTIYNKLI